MKKGRGEEAGGTGSGFVAQRLHDGALFAPPPKNVEEMGKRARDVGACRAPPLPCPLPRAPTTALSHARPRAPTALTRALSRVRALHSGARGGRRAAAVPDDGGRPRALREPAHAAARDGVPVRRVRPVPPGAGGLRDHVQDHGRRAQVAPARRRPGAARQPVRAAAHPVPPRRRRRRLHRRLQRVQTRGNAARVGRGCGREEDGA